MTLADNIAAIDKRTLVWRGIRGRCPKCGEGALFKSYLKQNDLCPTCGEDFTGIRADDGPAWLTILLTLHLIVPISVTVMMNNALPQQIGVALMIALTIAVAMLLLPRSKGAFIAVLWYLRTKRQADLPHPII